MKRLRFNLRYLLGSPRWDTGIAPPEVIEYVENHQPGRALDIGCGTGTNLLYLAQSGWQVDGIDFSRLAVGKARRRLVEAGFPPNVWVEDAAHLTKIQGEYNYILDIGCFHNLSPADKLGEMNSVRHRMAPGACWMIYAHCWNPSGSSTHGVTEQDIASLANRFTLTRRVDGQEGSRGPSVWLWLEGKDL